MTPKMDNFRPWKWQKEEGKDIYAYQTAVSHICRMIDERIKSQGENDELVRLAQKMVIKVGEAVHGINDYSFDKYKEGNRNPSIHTYASTKQTHPEINKLTEVLKNTINLLNSEPKNAKQSADECVKSAHKLRVESIKANALFLPRYLVFIPTILTMGFSHMFGVSFIERLSENLKDGLYYYSGNAATLHKNIQNTATELQTYVNTNKSQKDVAATMRDTLTEGRKAEQDPGVVGTNDTNNRNSNPV